VAADNQHRRSQDGRAHSQGSVALPALGGVGILASLVMSAIALVNSGSGATTSEIAATMTNPSSASAAVGSAAPTTSQAGSLDVTIRAEYKLGSDGKKHDAYSQTDFAVQAGRPLTLRIDNTDNQPHSITSTQAGVDIIALPGTHTYSMLVKRAGRFWWRCVMGCDTGAAGWAMTHPGYMAGYITAT
jgi:membrane fusion protein, multidrug efflux system